jgi:hypothetical protein
MLESEEPLLQYGCRAMIINIIGEIKYDRKGSEN